jgi:hypothetical protein
MNSLGKSPLFFLSSPCLYQKHEPRGGTASSSIASGPPSERSRGWSKTPGGHCPQAYPARPVAGAAARAVAEDRPDDRAGAIPHRGVVGSVGPDRGAEGRRASARDRPPHGRHGSRTQNIENNPMHSRIVGRQPTPTTFRHIAGPGACATDWRDGQFVHGGCVGIARRASRCAPSNSWPSLRKLQPSALTNTSNRSTSIVSCSARTTFQNAAPDMTS